MFTHTLIGAVLCLALVFPAFPAAVVFSATGLNTVAIQPTVDSFRAALGTNNGAAATPFPSGRREINWDGVPDALAAPNNMPANQFQGRGVLFSTAGTGFQVSANAGIAPIEFDNLFAGNSAEFAPFSPQRLFTALGSTVTDVTFLAPGTNLAAYTSAFGVVFSDVDLANVSSLAFFDLNSNSLGTFSVPNTAGSQTFSFLGILFNAGERVGRVRITAGDHDLATTLPCDCVAMDDFIYAEPQSVVPEPSTALMLSGGLLGMGAFLRFRQCRRKISD